ncbi:MAG: hypothetical protein FRX49_01875 [Trebouxia sp. A1-2]|nr:MAG: hypothetical protein FRX49_01875 [Trebouxia sp. A1-2]
MTLGAQSKPPKTSVDQKGSSSNKRERTGFLRAFDWIIRPWHYFNTIPRAVAYLIAGSGFYGGALFVIGSFAGCSPAVANSFVGGDGLRSQYDWLVLFIFMLGTYFFTVGCTLLFVDACNTNYPAQMAAWNANRRQGKRPRYHIIGFHPKSYAWWGGLSYTIGALQYNIAATTGLADNFPRVYNSWSANTYKWASTVMYTWGGPFFMIAGTCYVLLDMGLPGLWLGTILPFRKQDRFRLTWWTNWWNFWGGVLFCVGGVFLNYYPNIIPFHPTYQIENGINYGGGSFCFFMSGLLMYIQMSIRDEDTLPLSLPPEQRDSISRPSMTGDVGPTGTTSSQPPLASELHRDDSARATKGATSIQ